MQRLFKKSNILIAPSVYKEIRRATQLGLLSYSPSPQFSKIKLNSVERKLTKEIHARRKLGQGDCECLIIAKQRRCLLLTNDHEAQREANSLLIDYINLPLILRELWKTDLMTREQVVELVKEIETKDSIIIKSLDLILK